MVRRVVGGRTMDVDVMPERLRFPVAPVLLLLKEEDDEEASQRRKEDLGMLKNMLCPIGDVKL